MCRPPGDEQRFQANRAAVKPSRFEPAARRRKNSAKSALDLGESERGHRPFSQISVSGSIWRATPPVEGDGEMSGFRAQLWRASFLLLTFASGCINIERSYPEKNFFVLEIGRDEKVPPSHQTVNGILEVSELRISPRYHAQGFIYRISEA